MSDVTPRPSDLPAPLADFGQLLKLLRRRAGLTQSALALAVGYSREQITKLEHNQRLPDLAALQAAFMPALGLEHQPALAEQLLRLATAARQAQTTPGREVFAANAPQPARTNLPIPLTSFIGREREIAEVKRLLAEVRLLAVTGAGGVGKTRLALQLGREVLEMFPDGVWFIELAVVDNPDFIPNAIAQGLGLPPSSRQPSEMSLVAFMRDRHLLLILDNCEHLLVAVARLAEQLLRGAPRLHILATSRESLGILSATTWRLPSLTLPAANSAFATEQVRGQLAQIEAVQLFLARAASHNPAVTLTQENAPHIIQICRRLDGIPLAIELATQLVYALSLEQIAARLDNRFQLLTSGNSAALPRQQTLRAMLDWSYELLTEPERTLLCQMAVFNGGWTLEAAEAISRAATASVLLAHLVDKSLIVLDRPSGRPRYRLLETVRNYARDRLQENGALEDALNRHLEFYVAWVEQTEPQLRTPQQPAAYGAFEAELDNLRSALAWAPRRGQGQAALRLLAGLWFFWFWRGYWREGLAWARDILEAEPLRLAASPAKARALIGASNLAGRAGDYARFAAWLEAGRALADELEDKDYMAWARVGASVSMTDYPQIQAVLAEAICLAQTAGNRWLEADILFMYGDRARANGDGARAAELYTHSVAMFQAVGDQDVIANPIGNLGRLAFGRGEYAAARAAFETSIAMLRAINNKAGLADWLIQLGHVAVRQGDYPQAQTVLVECLPLCQEVGNQEAIADCLIIAASLAQAQARLEQAVERLAAADLILERFNLLHQIVEPASYAEFSRFVSQLRQALPGPAFEAAWAAGHGRTTQTAIELVLSSRPI